MTVVGVLACIEITLTAIEMRKAQGCFVRDAVLPKQLWRVSSLA